MPNTFRVSCLFLMNLRVWNYNSEQVQGILFPLLFACILFHFLGVRSVVKVI